MTARTARPVTARMPWRDCRHHEWPPGTWIGTLPVSATVLEVVGAHLVGETAHREFRQLAAADGVVLEPGTVHRCSHAEGLGSTAERLHGVGAALWLGRGHKAGDGDV